MDPVPLRERGAHQSSWRNPPTLSDSQSENQYRILKVNTLRPLPGVKPSPSKLVISSLAQGVPAVTNLGTGRCMEKIILLAVVVYVSVKQHGNWLYLYLCAYLFFCDG